MTDLTKYFIDLSKCSEEQRKHIFSLLPEEDDEKQYEITRVFKYLHYDEIAEYWFVDSLTSLNKTELTYPEFIKLFEGGETIKSDNTETLANALQQIEKLKADKEELLEALGMSLRLNKAFGANSEWIEVQEIESLIQKMKQ